MRKNKIAVLFMFIVVVFSLITIGIQVNKYLEELETLINDKNIIIEQLRQRDSIKSELDSSRFINPSSAILFTQGDKTITSDELVKYANKLTKEMDALEDSLEYYQAFYDLSKRKIKTDFSVEKYNGQKTYSFKSNVVDVDTVQTILKSSSEEWALKLNEEYKSNAKLRDKLDMYERAINKYGIQFNNLKDDGHTISYIIEAPKIDSALMLLPFYRKELRYNSRTKEWTVGLKRFF